MIEKEHCLLDRLAPNRARYGFFLAILFERKRCVTLSFCTIGFDSIIHKGALVLSTRNFL